MAETSFDPARAVRFDLPQGRVQTGADAERVLLVPAAALDEVALSAPAEAIEALARAMGAAIGRRAAAGMADAAGASLETFVTHLAGEAAISGIGAVSVERWGRALVVAVEGSPLNSTMLAPLILGAVEVATGRNVACTLLARDEHVARIFVGGERGIGRVREWLSAGVPWADALARLHGGVS